MMQNVTVRSTSTGNEFTATVSKGRQVARPDCGALLLHDDGTASHIGNGGVLDPFPCATWTVE